MTTDRRKLGQTVWAVLLIAMGMLLFVKTPYAIEAGSGNGFLNFARYFIGALLIVGGGRKIFTLYISKTETESSED